MNVFSDALKTSADTIRSGASTNPHISPNPAQLALYNDAANAIHADVGNDLIGSYNCAGGENPSLNAKLMHFFQPSAIRRCGIPPLNIIFKEYLDLMTISGGTNFRMFYRAPYTPPPSPTQNTHLMTGYSPGPRHGADQDSSLSSPLIGALPSTPSPKEIFIPRNS